MSGNKSVPSESGTPETTRLICVDVRRAAELLGGVSPFVVRDWIASGLLPCVKFPSTRRPGELSRRVLILVEDLQQFAKRHRETGRG